MTEDPSRCQYLTSRISILLAGYAMIIQVLENESNYVV